MSTVLAVRFPAGRYHATPWGSHPNEGGVEWPPSPWRLYRGLIATWHRKISPTRFPREVLAGLIGHLSESDPLYRLPPAVRAHSRHYMPVRDGRIDKPALVFDAFVRVDPSLEMIVAWPDVALHDSERVLLAALVHVTGYVGRAESWIEGRLMDEYGDGFNSAPPDSPALAAVGGLEPVSLLASAPAAEYVEWRARSIDELGLNGRRLTRRQKQLLATLPPSLTDALEIDTGDLRDAGWNLPPGGRMVTYQRPRMDGVLRTPQPRRTVRRKQITTVRIALAGRPLPRIEDAVRIGELVRIATISRADHGDGSTVPSEISGHGLSDEHSHRHAFYMPEDADDDGLIDHVTIHAPGGLSREAVSALDRLDRLWTKDGDEWPVAFEGAWEDPQSSGSVYRGTARTWASVTPYLHPWFRKPGFGVPEQITRECEARGLPAPIDIRLLQAIRVHGRDRRPVHFHRFRSKRGLRQPDRSGSVLSLMFADPVVGPLALGFSCHYGLGMFVRREE